MTVRTWPTRLDGDPVSCVQLGAHLRRMAQDVAAMAAGVSQERATVAWVGSASGNAALRVSACATAVQRTASRLRELADGTTALGEELARVASELGRARAGALAAGLPATADGFSAPEGHGAAALVQAAREREARAHQALGSLLVSVTQGAFARRTARDLGDGLLLLPPDGDAWDRVAWGVGLPGALVSLPTDRLKANVSLVVSGATSSTDARVARTARAVEAAEPVGKGVLKGLGVAGNLLTVGLDGREQWRADADDPALTEAERVGRTAVRGAIEGGLTIGGAALCAAALSPIPGGAFVGGVVGGKLGEIGGKWAADIAVEHVDDVIELASDAADLAGDAAEAASDAADAVGDVAGEVSDKLCFWD